MCERVFRCAPHNKSLDAGGIARFHPRDLTLFVCTAAAATQPFARIANRGTHLANSVGSAHRQSHDRTRLARDGIGDKGRWYFYRLRRATWLATGNFPVPLGALEQIVGRERQERECN